MGFGHRVYKNFDPRAQVLKQHCDKLLNKSGINDPLLDIARRIEEIALNDEYFISRKLYPNVDFYSGLILRAAGIPTNMFTVLFAIGRMPGWLAHWREMIHGQRTQVEGADSRQLSIGRKRGQRTQVEVSASRQLGIGRKRGQRTQVEVANKLL